MSSAYIDNSKFYGPLLIISACLTVLMPLSMYGMRIRERASRVLFPDRAATMSNDASTGGAIIFLPLSFSFCGHLHWRYSRSAASADLKFQRSITWVSPKHHEAP